MIDSILVFLQQQNAVFQGLEPWRQVTLLVMAWMLFGFILLIWRFARGPLFHQMALFGRERYGLMVVMWFAVLLCWPCPYYAISRVLTTAYRFKRRRLLVK